jgi:transcriptional regulator with XRE-family HTH domain
MRSDLNLCFADSLRAFRLDSGFTQQALAKECNLDRTFISMLERGLREPGLSTVFAIAKAFRISATEFVSDVDARKDFKEEQNNSTS